MCIFQQLQEKRMRMRASRNISVYFNIRLAPSPAGSSCRLFFFFFCDKDGQSVQCVLLSVESVNSD